MGLLQLYSLLLLTHPLMTKSVTSALLFGVGDLTSQWVERTLKMGAYAFDSRRTVAMTVYGGLFAGPILHFYYSKLLVRMFPGYNWSSTIKKVCIDQTVACSLLMAFYFIVITIMNGGSIADGTAKLNKDFWSVMISNWMVWPFVQLVNFGMVPVSYQVLVVNIVAIFWNTYLSYVTFAGQERKISS